MSSLPRFRRRLRAALAILLTALSGTTSPAADEPPALRPSQQTAAADVERRRDVILAVNKALWEYAERSARRIFGRRLGVPLADILLEALRGQGPLTATAISGLFGRHRSAEELHQALDLLRDLGLVVRRVEETGGRPATLWVACAERETNETSA